MYITILVKQVYWYISRVSGERLQDHLSSGLNKVPNGIHIISAYTNYGLKYSIGDPRQYDNIHTARIQK